jgi:RNA polymerase sigma factor (sigma-70 family)
VKLKGGSTEAFDALYEKYWKEIYTAAFKRLQDPAQAKDITQDIFLQLWLKREENNIDNLPAYLFTATKNKVYNWMEKERRYTPVPELLLQLKTSRDQTDAELLRKEFMKAYEALIDTLPNPSNKYFACVISRICQPAKLPNYWISHVKLFRTNWVKLLHSSVLHYCWSR